jgi:hypothetical protein
MKKIEFTDNDLIRKAEVNTSFNKKAITIRVANYLNDCQSDVPKLEINVIEWDTRSRFSGTTGYYDNEMTFNGLTFSIPKKLEHLIPLMYDKVKFSEAEIAEKIVMRDEMVAKFCKEMGWHNESQRTN